MTRNIVILLIIALIGGVYFWLSNNNEQDAKISDGTKPNSALVSVTLPEQLSDNAIIGKRIFEAKCASCHGRNAAGQKGVAPPLIHKIYEPSHHGDESFQRAAALGVRAHHWPFGNMPPIDGLTRAEVSTIITYVRELQRTNGIN